MNYHRLQPDAALMQKQWESINKSAWRLRRVTGGALDLALLMSVEEGLRAAVKERVEFIQRKHNLTGD